MRLDVDDLRLFLYIAEYSSLTKAASRFNISVPGASARIKHVEDSFDTKLFYRTKHGLTLTPSGETFLNHARIIHRQVETLSSEMQDFTNGLRGHLRISANTTATSEFLPKALQTYLASHPKVDVIYREMSSPEVVRAVLDGATDIGVATVDGAQQDLVLFPYREVPWVLVVPLGHPLAEREAVSLAEVTDLRFVSILQAGWSHELLSLLAEIHHVPLSYRVETGNFEALCRMVEANAGIGIAPRATAIRYAETMAIRVVGLNDPELNVRLSICVRDQAMLPRLARDFLDVLLRDLQRPCLEDGVGQDPARLRIQRIPH